jgi:hypothetical protein
LAGNWQEIAPTAPEYAEFKQANLLIPPHLLGSATPSHGGSQRFESSSALMAKVIGIGMRITEIAVTIVAILARGLGAMISNRIG